LQYVLNKEIWQEIFLELEVNAIQIHCFYIVTWLVKHYPMRGNGPRKKTAIAKQYPKIIITVHLYIVDIDRHALGVKI
jgi:hypothetical protein